MKNKIIKELIKDYVNKEYNISVLIRHRYLSKLCKEFNLNSFEEIEAYLKENNKQNWLIILGMSQTRA